MRASARLPKHQAQALILELDAKVSVIGVLPGSGRRAPFQHIPWQLLEDRLTDEVRAVFRTREARHMLADRAGKPLDHAARANRAATSIVRLPDEPSIAMPFAHYQMTLIRLSMEIWRVSVGFRSDSDASLGV